MLRVRRPKEGRLVTVRLRAVLGELDVRAVLQIVDEQIVILDERPPAAVRRDRPTFAGVRLALGQALLWLGFLRAPLGQALHPRLAPLQRLIKFLLVGKGAPLALAAVDEHVLALAAHVCLVPELVPAKPIRSEALVVHLAGVALSDFGRPLVVDLRPLPKPGNNREAKRGNRNKQSMIHIKLMAPEARISRRQFKEKSPGDRSKFPLGTAALCD